MMLPDLFSAFQYTVVQNMFIAGLLASIACGIIGTYVVVRRLVFISGGIAHTCFGGVGLAYLLGFDPMLGALVFALGTAIAVGIAGLRTRIREDSTIGVLWVLGMALGLIFIRFAPGYVPDLGSILFGDILLVKSQDIWLMLFLVVAIVVIVAVFYRQLLALTFDEEFARIMGVPTEMVYILLLALIALTVVLLLKVVGVILVIALLTIPATISGLFNTRMKRMMLMAVLVGCIVTTLGSILSLQYNLPVGATIVVVASLALLIALVVKKVGGNLSGKAGAQTSTADGDSGRGPSA
jgi:zinc transport system permease protein